MIIRAFDQLLYVAGQDGDVLSVLFICYTNSPEEIGPGDVVLKGFMNDRCIVQTWNEFKIHITDIQKEYTVIIHNLPDIKQTGDENCFIEENTPLWDFRQKM